MSDETLPKLDEAITLLKQMLENVEASENPTIDECVDDLEVCRSMAPNPMRSKLDLLVDHLPDGKTKVHTYLEALLAEMTKLREYAANREEAGPLFVHVQELSEPWVVKPIASATGSKLVQEEHGHLQITCGQMVSIRPCAKEYNDKTFLGVYLGSFALTYGHQFQKSTGTLIHSFRQHNPAIFVPMLNKIIYGMESWWGTIKDEADLKAITDEDIDNVWYVKALKELHAKEGKPN